MTSLRQHAIYFQSYVHIIISNVGKLMIYAKILMLYVNMIMLHVDINKSRVNITNMLNVDIFFLHVGADV